MCRVDGNLLDFHRCNLILTSNKAENSIFTRHFFIERAVGVENCAKTLPLASAKASKPKYLRHVDVGAYKSGNACSNCDVTWCCNVKSRMKRRLTVSFTARRLETSIITTVDACGCGKYVSMMLQNKKQFANMDHVLHANRPRSADDFS